MQRGILRSALLGIAGLSAVPAVSARNDSFQVHPFTVNLSSQVPRMLDLISNTRLPSHPEYPGVGASYGMDLDVLKSLQDQWLHSYSWQDDEAYINSFHHFTTTISNHSLHFIHERSPHPNAIPLILFHGWPGSFLEFLPLVHNLTHPTDPTSPAFDIIIPSLPGFAFSPAPPANWTADATARLMHALMVDVLGYDTYALHGTDWGCAVGWALYDSSSFSAHVRAAHFAFLPFLPADYASYGAGLDALESFEFARALDWQKGGTGYFVEQSTEPNTIGLALYDSPVGQLSWIAAKVIQWSDPGAGRAPSVLTHREILRGVSLYYLSGSFVSAAYMYAQNPGGFRSELVMARTDAPMLMSAFKYNVGFWPRALAAKVGNLVSFKNHEFGGHFPGLDNPPAMVEDLRDIGLYWKRS